MTQIIRINGETDERPAGLHNGARVTWVSRRKYHHGVVVTRKAFPPTKYLIRFTDGPLTGQTLWVHVRRLILHDG